MSEIKRTYRGKQAWMASMKLRPHHTFHVAHGSVQSGKSESTLAGFLDWSRQFKGERFLIAAPTMQQHEQNTDDLFRWYSGHTVEVKYTHYKAFGNEYWRKSAIDERASGKLQGPSLRGAFVDEATKMPKTFVDQVLARCSKPNPKIVFCTNPEGPNHWFKREYVDKADEPDFDVVQFGLEDNPGLTVRYKESLRRMWTGAFLRRNYYGEWAAASGGIYPHYTVGTPPPEEDIHARYLAIDVAKSGITHALLMARYVEPREDWALAEWRFNVRERDTMQPSEQVSAIMEELVGDRHVLFAMVDPSAPDFISELNKVLPTVPAINDVLPGIQKTNLWFASNNLKISTACPYLVDNISNYSWDEKSAEKGEDKPVKQDDHGCDAIRYHVSTVDSNRGLVVENRWNDVSE